MFALNWYWTWGTAAPPEVPGAVCLELVIAGRVVLSLEVPNRVELAAIVQECED